MSQHFKKLLISEKLESPAQQQSQELYLVPRNCWLRVTSFQIRTSIVEKNQKIRIRFSVPNSARVVRTSSILIDDEIMNYLQGSKNAAGFCELPIDVIVLFEYKHDVRFGHQNNLEIDIEVVSNIWSRSKSLGNAIIDLSDVIQKPMKSTSIFMKDNINTGTMNIELHSISITKTTPVISTSDKMVNNINSLSESDNEPIQTTTLQVEKKIRDIFKSNIILLVDEETAQGKMLLRETGMNNFVIPVKDISLVKFIFETAAEKLDLSRKTGFRFIVAGDDNFFCGILRVFMPMRDQGIFSNDSFSFIYVSLREEANDSFAKICAEKSQMYSNNFFVYDWFSIFLEDSQVQNASSLINSKLNILSTSSLIPVNVEVANVLISTISDQFTVPMFLNVQIGDNIKTTQMKDTFVKEKIKTISL